jgi:toxin ParE1/3/4
VTRQVRILRRAERDLEEAYRYAMRDKPQAAHAALTRLLATIESLADHPDRGAVPKDSRLRQLGYRVLVHGAYLILYKILRRQIRVYRVLHGRRRYEACL